MSFLDNLITLPDQRLRQESRDVNIKNDDIQALSAKMQNTVLEWEQTRPHEVGVALSAIQIAEPYKVVVVRRDFSDKNNREFITLINPVITKFNKTQQLDYEGCLSIVDIYGSVPRYTKVTVRALSLEGKDIQIEADGFMARVLQHEIDHTHGVMFIDHIKQADSFYNLSDTGLLEKISYQKIMQMEDLWVMA